MPMNGDLRDHWRNDVGGKYSEYVQPRGFCLAACQYWVSSRQRGTRASAISDTLRAREDAIALRFQHIHGRSKKIPGMTHRRVAGRTLGLGALKSREALMDHVLNGQEGLYIYSPGKLLGSGHAMAFERRNGKFRFFDPNTGTWSARIVNEDTRTRIREWFDEYWARTYKSGYHFGGRELTFYDVDGTDLLDIARNPVDFNPIPNF